MAVQSAFESVCRIFSAFSFFLFFFSLVFVSVFVDRHSLTHLLQCAQSCRLHHAMMIYRTRIFPKNIDSLPLFCVLAFNPQQDILKSFSLFVGRSGGSVVCVCVRLCAGERDGERGSDCLPLLSAEQPNRFHVLDVSTYRCTTLPDLEKLSIFRCHRLASVQRYIGTVVSSVVAHYLHTTPFGSSDMRPLAGHLSKRLNCSRSENGSQMIIAS